ncbi:hypothetical protein M3Y99_01867800 [Aphelenchoides fujianensis]|nr:hypothetical protein M3Y99_01867800 [Aphelenchoides fujianensis]
MTGSATIFTQLRHFHVFYEAFMGLFSYLLNALVIYLALYKSTRALREYRVIIIWSACVDLIFNTANLADLTFGKLYFTNAGPLERIPQPFSLAACVFWMFGLYLTVLNVAAVFAYRYNVLVRNKRDYLRKFALIYAQFVVLIAVQAALGFVCFETNLGAPHYAADLKANGMFAENTPPFSVVDAATYPFLFLATPIFLAAGLPLFGLKASGLGLILCSMVTLLPLLNAITVIFVVPSFRHAVLMRAHRMAPMTGTGDLSSKLADPRSQRYTHDLDALNTIA